MSEPTVSVIVPAYNAKATIAAAIQSVLDQTYPAHEIIVVDDGSTDGTGDVVRQTFGDRVTLITQANSGVAEARNRGMAAASGEFVQFLDSDDMLAPDKLRRSVDACLSTGCDVSYSQAVFVEADGVTPHPIQFPTLPSGDVLLAWLTGTMANGSFGVASSMFVRRETLMATGAFEKACTPCEDWDMWIRLATTAQFAALNAPLVIYRVSPSGLSRHQLNMAKGRLTVIRRARQLAAVQTRLSQKALDALEAGRWHLYAIRLWENGQRSEARTAFQTANALAYSSVRRLYALMSYMLPAKSTAAVERVLQLRRS